MRSATGTQPPRAREQWATRTGFLMAAIGSAVGLGNIWRFPYIAYDNGGGAFLVPYLIALLTAGIPVLILMYTIGHKFRGSPPLAWRRLSRPAEAIGWWQVAICVVISTYYAVIIAWAVRYTGFSLGLDWGDDPAGFLFGDFLRATEDVGSRGAFVSGVGWPLVAVWVVTLGVLILGVSRGIERANKVMIPLLFVLFATLVVRALTLDGAGIGLDALFTPDWEAITDGSVWVAAYGQIFFSLSVGFGIMITYASYLRRKSDLTGSALVAGFANSSFELLAGIGVFAVLGFMSAQSGVAVGEVLGEGGIGLAFVAFPQIISEMPAPELFGVGFFASLVIAGFSSLVSIVQVVVASVEDRTGMSRTPAVLLVCGAMAIVSVAIYASEGGLWFLDVADHFVNQYGIALAALVAIVVVAWLLRKLPMLQAHADEISAVRLGMWWQLALAIVTPVVLGWMMIDSLQQEFDENYGGYDTGFLVGAGWMVALAVLVIGVLLSLLPWRTRDTMTDQSVP